MTEVLEMTGYRPGALAQVVQLHMDYYAPVWGFGSAFETRIAGGLAAFLSHLDDTRDHFRCVYAKDRLLASITIDGKAADDEGAHLRWFIVSEAARGKGLGRRLLTEAITFCQERGYRRIFLTTFAGLETARHLYEAFGFRLVQEQEEDRWNSGVREQRFELDL